MVSLEVTQFVHFLKLHSNMILAVYQEGSNLLFGTMETAYMPTLSFAMTSAVRSSGRSAESVPENTRFLQKA